MEEIKVGEFVRTRGGNIRKITKIAPYYENDKPVKDYDWVELDELGNISTYKRKMLDEFVTKHSPNIIDLIEAGDYVNGYKVKYVCNEEPCPSGKYVDIDCELDSSESYFFENQIKSIVTREQFKNAEYRLED